MSEEHTDADASPYAKIVGDLDLTIAPNSPTPHAAPPADSVAQVLLALTPVRVVRDVPAAGVYAGMTGDVLGHVTANGDIAGDIVGYTVALRDGDAEAVFELPLDAVAPIQGAQGGSHERRTGY